MNTLEIDGSRDGSQGRLKQKWNMLTTEDLQYSKGRHVQWFDRIQKLTGETRDVIEKAIKEVFSSCSWQAKNAGPGDQVSQSPLSA